LKMTIRIKHPDKAFLRALREAGVDVGPKDTPKSRTRGKAYKRTARRPLAKLVPSTTPEPKNWVIAGIIIVVVLILIAWADHADRTPPRVDMPWIHIQHRK
jgi:hypothetical protein